MSTLMLPWYWPVLVYLWAGYVSAEMGAAGLKGSTANKAFTYLLLIFGWVFIFPWIPRYIVKKQNKGKTP